MALGQVVGKPPPDSVPGLGPWRRHLKPYDAGAPSHHRPCAMRRAVSPFAGLEKDIAGLKREIRERDDTIGDKERRIYELKKKNQVGL